VNRNKLRAYSPSFEAATRSGTQTLRVGGKNAIQNLHSFLSGILADQTQFSSAHFAIDAALSHLEREGVALSLSSPTLTVLSGEQALFQGGGQIPIPQSLVTVLSSTGGAPGRRF